MKRKSLFIIILFLLTFISVANGQNSRAAQSPLPVQWPQTLFETPAVFTAPKEYAADGLKSVFLAGPAYHGKPTQIFAYYGIPKLKAGEKCPGIVLIHGGGGTAFADWVRLWNSRGYAAIAMDTCGCLPGGEHNNRPRHDYGGPAGWGNFASSMEPVTEQWVYHAVSSVILSDSFLRSLPGVDPGRIGVTGISWGGFLACISAAVDTRFRFAVPVYGCGFLDENSVMSPEIAKLGETGSKWADLWDPKHYLPKVVIPILWVTGANDFAFPMDSLQKSYRLPAATHTLCIRLGMKHGHGGPGENPGEIRVLPTTSCFPAQLCPVLSHRDGKETMFGCHIKAIYL